MIVTVSFGTILISNKGPGTSSPDCNGDHEHHHERERRYKPIVDADDDNGIPITLGSEIKGSKRLGDTNK